VKQERDFSGLLPTWTAPPPFSLMNAVFGEPTNEYQWNDSPPYLEELPNGHSLWWSIRQVFVQWPLPLTYVSAKYHGSRRPIPRQRDILIQRFLLSPTPTLEALAKRYGVARELIRNNEGMALRRMRHPARTQLLRPHLRVLTNADRQRGLDRMDLAERLEQFYLPPVAAQVAVSIRRSMLREAFQSVSKGRGAVGQVLARGCILPPSRCLQCREFTLPTWDFCSDECRRDYRSISVVCDGCGGLFKRPACTVAYRLGVIGHRHSFCNRACFFRFMKGRKRRRLVKTAEV
jgi:hypothetical protein